MSPRLIDYFLVVGYGDSLRPLKSPDSLLFQASVTDRYPTLDYPDSPLPDSMPMFCIPDGIRLTNAPELPVFYTFANTLASGNRLYGACLRFYEPVPKEIIDKLNEEKGRSRMVEEIEEKLTNASVSQRMVMKRINSNKVNVTMEKLYAAKCICFLSSWPFLDSFRAVLTSLYRASLSRTSICIERFLSNLLGEIPLPPQGKVQVQFSVGSSGPIILRRPPPNDPLAFVDFRLSVIFENLSLENIIKVVECLMLERQVLLLTTHFSLLTVAAECFLALLYPFVWQNVYIPFLPQAAIDFINAPMPFLIGTHVSFLDLNTIPEHICVVNLDSNSIRLPILIHTGASAEQQHITLPEKERMKLMESLVDAGAEKLVQKSKSAFAEIDLAFKNAPPPSEVEENSSKTAFIESRVRYAFFRAFISIFRNYRDFLLDPEKMPKNTVNKEGSAIFSDNFNTSDFIRKNHSSERFLQVFCQSLAFQKFIDDRLYISPETQGDVLFFDQSIMAKLNRSFFSRYNHTPFLNDRTFDISKTYIALTPDTSNLPSDSFTYVCWPQLQRELFVPSRLIDSPFKADISNSDQIVYKHKRRGSMSMISKFSTFSTPNKNLSANASDQCIYELWFNMFSASLKKPASPLELIPLYDIYLRMRTEGFSIEEFVYRVILESCGKAGTPDLAFQVLKDMQINGITPDAAAYSAIIATMDMNSHSLMIKNSSFSLMAESVQQLTKQLAMPGSDAVLTPPSSAFEAGGSASSFDFSDSNLFFSCYSTKNASPARKSLGMTPALQTEYFLSLFEAAFPKLTIISIDSCMECQKTLQDHEIRAGWNIDSNDYTTVCPYCQCRFVARFSVKPKGLDDPSKIIVCEYLSPMVLRKEVETLLIREREDFILSKDFRKSSATCFWNLAWHLSNMLLPMEGILIPVAKPSSSINLSNSSSRSSSINSSAENVSITIQASASF